MNNEHALRDYEGRKVLVTGGAGFIGSHLVKTLLDLGCEVHVADNLSRGSLENLKEVLDKIRFHYVDLTRFENCLSVTRDMEYVFHLAASVGGIHYIGKARVRCFTPDVLMHTYMLEATKINRIPVLKRTGI
mgnify:FL=1